ncbi:hypothetical protein GQ42DRAFT_163618 [Ramicandelaber brevisporus]|nr:hypothetical protein GQ42DRAFT_163618 [Ramicandelaber brevisporus]
MTSTSTTTTTAAAAAAAESSKQYDCDVLIVGAGPVGLTLAYNLRRFGIDCRIIDKSPQPATTSRAFGIQPRVLEILAALDLLPAFEQAGGKYHPGTSIIRGTTAVPFVSYDNLPSSQKNILLLEQDYIEALLSEKLEKYGGITVERGTEVTEFEIDADGVTAKLVKRSAKSNKVYDWFAINHLGSDINGNGGAANGRQQQPSATGLATPDSDDANDHSVIRARFLVGCDGAHSSIRKKMGWKFEGRTFSDEFTLADVDLVSNLPDALGAVWNTSSPFIVFDLPNQKPLTEGARRVRMGYRRGALDAKLPQLTEDTFVTDIKSIAGPEVTLQISNITWLTTFKLNERLSEKYVDDKHYRVVLAGDAAHCHSPAGGQGLNLGMQDAFDLAAKLALAVKFGSDHKVVLQTYEQERRPIAAGVLEHSGRMMDIQFGNGWFAYFARSWLLPNIPKMLKSALSLRNSQLGVQYGRTAMVDNSVALLQLKEYGNPGRRFPDTQVEEVASGKSVSMQKLLASDAVFHVVALVPSHLSAEDKQLVANLNSLITRLNAKKPTITHQSTVSAPSLVSTFASVVEIAPAYASSSALEVAHFRDPQTRNLQKALSSNPGMWPAQSNDMAVVLVRPDGMVGMVASLNTKDALDRVEHYLSQF